jgi:hypothetical protein
VEYVRWHRDHHCGASLGWAWKRKTMRTLTFSFLSVVSDFSVSVSLSVCLLEGDSVLGDLLCSATAAIGGTAEAEEAPAAVGWAAAEEETEKDALAKLEKVGEGKGERRRKRTHTEGRDRNTRKTRQRKRKQTKTSKGEEEKQRWPNKGNTYADLCGDAECACGECVPASLPEEENTVAEPKLILVAWGEALAVVCVLIEETADAEVVRGASDTVFSLPGSAETGWEEEEVFSFTTDSVKDEETFSVETETGWTAVIFSVETEGEEEVFSFAGSEESGWPEETDVVGTFEETGGETAEVTAGCVWWSGLDRGDEFAEEATTAAALPNRGEFWGDTRAGWREAISFRGDETIRPRGE